MDVSLVANVLPKDSRFLPRIAVRKQDYFFPLECFHMACEMLSGQAKCYSVFSHDVPPSQYEDHTASDLVVIKVYPISIRLVSV
jgi:hypothetical protein